MHHGDDLCRFWVLEAPPQTPPKNYRWNSEFRCLELLSPGKEAPIWSAENRRAEVPEPNGPSGRAAKPREGSAPPIAGAFPSRPQPPETQSRWCRLWSARAHGPAREAASAATGSGGCPPVDLSHLYLGRSRTCWSGRCVQCDVHRVRGRIAADVSRLRGHIALSKSTGGDMFRAAVSTGGDIRGPLCPGRRPRHGKGGDLSPLGGHNLRGMSCRSDMSVKRR